MRIDSNTTSSNWKVLLRLWRGASSTSFPKTAKPTSSDVGSTTPPCGRSIKPAYLSPCSSCLPILRSPEEMSRDSLGVGRVTQHPSAGWPGQSLREAVRQFAMVDLMRSPGKKGVLSARRTDGPCALAYRAPVRDGSPGGSPENPLLYRVPGEHGHGRIVGRFNKLSGPPSASSTPRPPPLPLRVHEDGPSARSTHISA
jgi:hypothetical protein